MINNLVRLSLNETTHIIPKYNTTAIIKDTTTLLPKSVKPVDSRLTMPNSKITNASVVTIVAIIVFILVDTCIYLF